ncbi:MAG: hypothetical protein Q9187_004723 [Circinaria calcarea]
MVISENLERFERYKIIFTSSKPLQESIAKLYHDIAEFAIQAAQFYAKSSTNIVTSFHRHSDLVRDQAWLAYFDIDLQRKNARIDDELRSYEKDVEDLEHWLCANNNDESLLLNLLIILRSHPSQKLLVKLLRELRTTCGNPRHTQDISDLLWKAFHSSIRMLPLKELYFIIDGIDELYHEDQLNFIDNLLLLQNGPSDLALKVKVIVTSRLEYKFRSHQTNSLIKFLDIDSCHTESDIKMFVHATFRDSIRLRSIDPPLRNEVASELIARSEGMFLWVNLVLRELEKQAPSVQLQRAMGKALITLNETFKDYINHIVPGSGIYFVYQVLVAAARPISLKDLQSLLEVELESSDTGRHGRIQISLEDCIYELYGSVIVSKDGHVQFFHHIFKEYLLSSQVLNLPSCHSMMAALCLTYASSDKFNFENGTQTLTPDNYFQSLVQNYPLLDYAINFWSFHFSEAKYTNGLSCSNPAAKALRKARNVAWMERVCYNSNFLSKAAQDYQVRNMEARTVCKGPNDLETISSTIEVAIVLQRQGNVRGSQIIFEKILTLQNSKNLTTLQQHQALAGLSRSYERQGRWKDAGIQYQRWLRFCRDMGRKGGRHTIEAQNGLAWVLKAQGCLSGAISLYEESYATAKNLFGATHVETRMAANELTFMYEQDGRGDRARAILLFQMNECRQALGPTHSTTTESISLLTSFLERRGESKEAEILCQELYDECQGQSLSNIDIGQRLAGMLEERGGIDEAEAVLRSLSKASAKHRDSNYTNKVRASIALAEFYLRHRRWEEALTNLELYKSGLNERSCSEDLFRITLSMAICMEKQGLLMEAKKKFEDLLAIRESSSGWLSRRTMDAGNELAAYLERQQQWDSASKTYQHIHSSYRKTLGAEHRYTIAASKSLAAYHERRREWHEAEKLYDSIYELTISTRGRDHHDVKEIWKRQQITKLHQLEV